MKPEVRESQIEDAIFMLYGLNVHSPDKVTKGFLSENHALQTDDAPYFLKRYRFDSEERIEEIHAAKNYFLDGGIPVIMPLAHKGGKTHFFFGGAYYALFPYITDREFDRGTLPDTAVVSLAEMLARIHLRGKDATLPIEKKFNGWNRDWVLAHIDTIQRVIDAIAEPTEFDLYAKDILKIKHGLVAQNRITLEDLGVVSDHLVHGDYLDTNVFFNRSDQVSYVFDFEKTAYEPRLFELFRAATYSFFYKEVAKEDIMRVKLFINSYREIYPMSRDELEKGLKLFWLKTLHSAWVETEHYLNKNYRVDCLLQDHRLRYLATHYQEFERSLMGE